MLRTRTERVNEPEQNDKDGLRRKTNKSEVRNSNTD